MSKSSMRLPLINVLFMEEETSPNPQRAVATVVEAATESKVRKKEAPIPTISLDK